MRARRTPADLFGASSARPAAADPGKLDADRPTTETDSPNLSTEHQGKGDARRPSDKLDIEQGEGEETIPRKSSLLGND